MEGWMVDGQLEGGRMGEWWIDGWMVVEDQLSGY